MYDIAPPNMSDLGPRDTGYRPIHRSEDLTILCLLVCLLVGSLHDQGTVTPSPYPLTRILPPGKERNTAQTPPHRGI